MNTTSSADTNRQVIFYLAYHKTASKWIWGNFFEENYPSHQLNILLTPPDELRKITCAGDTSRPFVMRLRIEDGSMGAELPNLVEAMVDANADAKVVLSIRSQRSLLPSHYGQYVANGGKLGFRQYLADITRVKWHYYPIIKSLHDAYGERLFVCLFEEFRQDSFATLRQLRDFIGESGGGVSDDDLRKLAALPAANPQRNDLVIDAMLALNRARMRPRRDAIIPMLARPGHDHIAVEIAGVAARLYNRASGKTIRYRAFDDKGILGEAYGEENAALAKLLDRPLHEMGYPMLGTGNQSI